MDPIWAELDQIFLHFILKILQNKYTNTISLTPPANFYNFFRYLHFENL